MANTNKIKTNLIEILLKETLIGKTMYLDNGTQIIIDDVNYQPALQEVYVQSGNDGYKLSLNANYDFDLELEIKNKIQPNKGRIVGGNKLF